MVEFSCSIPACIRFPGRSTPFSSSSFFFFSSSFSSSSSSSFIPSSSFTSLLPPISLFQSSTIPRHRHTSSPHFLLCSFSVLFLQRPPALLSCVSYFSVRISRLASLLSRHMPRPFYDNSVYIRVTSFLICHCPLVPVCWCSTRDLRFLQILLRTLLRLSRRFAHPYRKLRSASCAVNVYSPSVAPRYTVPIRLVE